MKGFVRRLIDCKDYYYNISPEAKWLNSKKWAIGNLFFNYKRQITVTEQSGNDLTDYQVLIELNSTNFDFSHVSSDGSDIRFGIGDILYPYWIEKWDSANQEAKIWVKVPSIPANGTTSFYMYYGNSDLVSASNGEDTFEFFDDFINKGGQFNKVLVSNEAYGSNGINVSRYIAESLWSFNGYQYITFIDKNGNVMVGKRKLPNGPWSIVDTGYDVSANDVHSVSSLGIDPNGYIHIAYGMHNASLQYIKSNNPEDISSFSSASMTGQNENSVTYPTFFTDGNYLYFAYRNGESGDGELYLNKYDHNTGTWNVLQHPLINSPDATRNPYWDDIVVDCEGKIHISWCWRDTSDASTNHDICYAYSDDGGQTWKKSDGTIYSLPILYENSEIIDSVPTNGGLSNQNGLAVDSKNRPHIVYCKLDEDGHENYYHAWFDGSNWHINKITHFTSIDWNDMESEGYNCILARPCILTDGTKVIVLFRAGDAGYLYIATADEPYTSWEFVRFDEIWGWTEVNYDKSLWSQNKQLYIVAQRALGENPESLYILEIDLTSLDLRDESIIAIWEDYSSSYGIPSVNNYELNIDAKTDLVKSIVTYLNQQFTLPFVIEFEEYEKNYYTDSTNWMGIQFCKNNKNDWTEDSGHTFFIRHNSDYALMVDSSTVASGSQTIITPTEKHKVTVKAKEGSIKIYLNDTLLIDWTGNMTRTSGWISIVNYGFYHCVDNIRVRKYTDPEPSVSIGNEETP